jgi:hypothetical protein
MPWPEAAGPVITTSGLTTLVMLWSEKRGRKSEAEKADAEADRIRTETYSAIIGDLRNELDRVRAALTDASSRVEALTQDLADAHAALGEIGVWARSMRDWSIVHARRLTEIGGTVDEVPVLDRLNTTRRTQDDRSTARP